MVNVFEFGVEYDMCMSDTTARNIWLTEKSNDMHHISVSVLHFAEHCVKTMSTIIKKMENAVTTTLIVYIQIFSALSSVSHVQCPSCVQQS